MRSTARECVFKYLFSRLFNQNDEGLFDVLTKDLSKEDKEFATSILNRALKNESEYLDKIEKLSIGYKLNRIFNVDKIVLIMGMSELDERQEIPVPVIVDEALKICAVYSTEKSTDFVNGILAEYAKETRNG